MTNTGDVQSIGGRQFQIVERGLDEKQVEEFINELLNRLKTAEESAETKGVTAVAEAKRLVEMLGEEAQQIRADAKAEASRIISEAESASSEESEAARKIVKATGEEARKVMEKAQARADSLERAVRHQANHVVESVQRQVQTRIKESLGKASQNIMDEFGRLSSEVDLLSSKVANRSPIDAEKHEGNADRPPLLSNGSPKLQPDPRREIERNVELVVAPPINPAGLAALLGHLLELENVDIRSTKKGNDGAQVIGIAMSKEMAIDQLLQDLNEVEKVTDGNPIIIQLR